MDEYEAEKDDWMSDPIIGQNFTPTDAPNNVGEREAPPPLSRVPSVGDDFGGVEKRPNSRGRKRKSSEGEGKKQKEQPSIVASAAGLLEQLKTEGIRREKNDGALAASLDKIAKSSALAGKSMQAVLDALLALVAQQAAQNR